MFQIDGNSSDLVIKVNFGLHKRRVSSWSAFSFVHSFSFFAEDMGPLLKVKHPRRQHAVDG